MKEIFSSFDQELFKKAERFSDFRIKCKEFLRKNGKEYDKFTVVEHDSSVGYISESLIADYLRSNYVDIEVSTWENRYNIRRVIDILNNNSYSEDDINYVTEYFYDRYDLHIKYKGKEFFIDVKSALSKKTPSDSWTFLYPVVQAHKEGKSGMVLAYCVVTDLKVIESMSSFVLVGFVAQNKVRECKKYLRGQKTRFNTVNQIDNYETLLSRHYMSIDALLNKSN